MVTQWIQRRKAWFHQGMYTSPNDTRLPHAPSGRTTFSSLFVSRSYMPIMPLSSSAAMVTAPAPRYLISYIAHPYT